MTVLIFLPLLFWIIYIYIYDRKFKKIIKESSSVEESIILRRKYEKYRKKIMIYNYVILSIIFIAYHYISNGIDSTFEYIRHLCVVLISTFAAYKCAKSYFKIDYLNGNVSSYTKDSYLQSFNQYILYLRGFTTDKRYHTIPLKKTYKQFHELEFVKLLNKKFEVCAVGLPGEVEAPYGATRVYLNNETWQNDVSQLIDKALHIYILVNNSESCIWEIIETRKYLSKTTLIVDNIELYNSARNILSTKIQLPKITLPPKKIARITFQEDLPNVSFYKNSINGYSAFLNISSKDIKTYLNLVGYILKRALIYILGGLIGAFALYYIKRSFFYSSPSTQYCILALPADSTSIVYKSGIRDTCVLIKYNDWVLNDSAYITAEFIDRQRDSVKNVIVYDIHKGRYIYKTFSEKIIGLRIFDGYVNNTVMDKIISDINAKNINESFIND